MISQILSRGLTSFLCSLLFSEEDAINEVQAEQLTWIIVSLELFQVVSTLIPDYPAILRRGSIYGWNTLSMRLAMHYLLILKTPKVAYDMPYGHLEITPLRRWT